MVSHPDHLGSSGQEVHDPVAYRGSGALDEHFITIEVSATGR